MSREVVSEPMPLVSIVTPNFNGERFMHRVVESVRRQQQVMLEHLIVDDCSTDKSWSLLQSLSEQNRWLKPVRLPHNSGPVVARNRAIELARGRFLAFLDVDDFWLPHKLQTQIAFMLERECAVSFSDYRFVSEDGLRIGRPIQGFNRIGTHLHHMTRYLGCLTVMVDREKIPDFRFPEISPATRAEDFLAWAQCIQRFGPAVRCPHDLARYAVVPRSRSSAKKGSLSVWLLYRTRERIPLFLASIYFISYSIGVFWKRYWNRPYMMRESIERDYEWSVVSRSHKKSSSL